MKSTSDEEAEKLLEAISRRISIFVLVESAGRDQNKNRDESIEIELPKAFKLPNSLVDFI